MCLFVFFYWNNGHTVVARRANIFKTFECVWLLTCHLLSLILGFTKLRHIRVIFTVRDCAIQIKICAEYRDMLPRPRLVCQEPGLRPIGRSPGVPDKSSRGLCSMSRYSAQILICFIAYIFLIFFHSSVGLVGKFARLPVCIVPSAIVHCNQNEAGHQTIKATSMPCWGAAGWSKHSLAFKSQPGENDR